MPGRMKMLSGSMVAVDPAALTFIWLTSPLPVTGVPVSRFRIFTEVSLAMLSEEPVARSSTVSVLVTPWTT